MSSDIVTPRLLVVNNLPSFYRTAPFGALINEWAAATGGDGEVFYQARRDPYRRQEWFYTPDDELPFKHRFLTRQTIRLRSRVTYLPQAGLIPLARMRPTHLLVAGWDTPIAMAAAAYVRSTGARLVSWVESNPSTSSHPGAAADAYRRLALSGTSGLLVPTDASARHAQRIMRRATPYLRLPNPVAIARLPEVAPARRRMIFVGDLSARKGFDTFLSALAHNAAHGWSGVAFGNDTEGLAAAGVPDNCEVMQGLHLEQIIPLLNSQSDVWTIPSRMDPAPLTFSEAMALGVRVVVSDAIAYTQQALPEGVCVTPADDPSALALSVREVIEGPRPTTDSSAPYTADYWAHELAQFMLAVERG